MFFMTDHFPYNIVKKYDSHPVSTKGSIWYSQQACKFLNLPH